MDCEPGRSLEGGGKSESCRQSKAVLSDSLTYPMPNSSILVWPQMLAPASSSSPTHVAVKGEIYSVHQRPELGQPISLPLRIDEEQLVGAPSRAMFSLIAMLLPLNAPCLLDSAWLSLSHE